MEDARDVHANRTLLRPIVDDDVGSTRLIVVRAHDDLDPCGGVTCIRPRIDEPGLHRPAIERGDVVAIVLPRHGRGVAKERVVAPPLAADRSKGPHHAAGRKVVECVPRHRSRGPSAHPPEPADEIVVGADNILVRNGVLADVGGHRVGVVGPVRVILIDGDAGRGNDATNENVGIPRHAPDVVVERHVAFEIDVLDIRSVVGEAFYTKRPIVEHDIVLQQQRGRLALAVDPVSQIVSASVVVRCGAVDLGPSGLRPDEDAVVRGVMDDQVDELRPGPMDVDAMEGLLLLRGGMRDLEPPKPGIRTGHEEGVRNRRVLARILAHHDGSVRRPHQRALEPSRVYGVRVRSAA